MMGWTLAAAAVSVPAALAAGFSPQHQHVLARQVVAAAGGAVLAGLMIRAGRRGSVSSSLGACTIFIALLLPLARESARDPLRSSLALAATAATVALADLSAWYARAVFLVLAAAASALEPTGLLFPLAYSWSTRSRPGRFAVVLAAGCLLAAAVVPRPGGGLFLGLAGHAMVRDLLILLPLLVLGLAGHAGRREADPAWVVAWATLGTLAILGILAGLHLDLRLCVLPLLWWAPAGLAELPGTLKTRFPARVVAAVCATVLAVLALPAARGWWHAALLSSYIVW